MFSSRKFKRYFSDLLPESVYLPILYYYRKISGNLEPELMMLPKILTDCRTAIDIGANRGLYTFMLSSLCRTVIAFEPQSWCVRKIIALKKTNVNVNNMALSNQDGSLTLYIPLDHHGVAMDGLASFTKMPDSIEQKVPVKKLDDFKFGEVDFIKIDVEGHECEVIDGAKETILREKPILLVEIEQRHQAKKIVDVFEEIINFGYMGFFILDGRLVAIDKFSYEKYQKPYLSNVHDRNYVNNFFFIPGDFQSELFRETLTEHFEHRLSSVC